MSLTPVAIISALSALPLALIPLLVLVPLFASTLISFCVSVCSLRISASSAFLFFNSSPEYFSNAFALALSDLFRESNPICISLALAFPFFNLVCSCLNPAGLSTFPPPATTFLCALAIFSPADVSASAISRAVLATANCFSDKLVRPGNI